MKRVLIAAAAVLLATLLLWGLLSSRAPEPSAALIAAAEGLDEITIDAVFSPEDRCLTVRQTLRLRNRTGENRKDVLLRAFPNAYQSLETSPGEPEEIRSAFYPEGFSTGSLTPDRICVNGLEVAALFRDDAKTLLSVPVALPPEEETLIEAEYRVYLPRAASGFGLADGVYCFGDAFLRPAWYDGTSFRGDALLPWGEAPVSDCANYTVTLTLPKSFQVAASAAGKKETSGENAVWRFSLAAARSFAFCLSEKMAVRSRVVNGVLLTACGQNGSSAGKMLKWLSSAVKCYTGLYGVYPYPSLTVCETAMEDEGATWPGLIMLGASAEPKENLAFLCAGEWWGVTVGNDTFDQAWMSEALSEYSLLKYLQNGNGDAQALLSEVIRPASLLSLPSGVTPGAPLDRFSTRAEYRRVTRERGVALLIAIENLLGDGCIKALSACYDAMKFTVPTREAFEAFLSRFCGEDLHPLMLDYLDTCP